VARRKLVKAGVASGLLTVRVLLSLQNSTVLPSTEERDGRPLLLFLLNERKVSLSVPCSKNSGVWPASCSRWQGGWGGAGTGDGAPLCPRSLFTGWTSL